MPVLSLSRLAAATAVVLAAGAAHAGTVTFHNWTYGSGNAVSVTAPNYSGAAGGFKATLSGFGALDGNVDTYCVDLYESFNFGVPYGDYSLVSAASHFSAAKATALGKLISHVFGGNLIGSLAAGFRDDESTALQLAIWNIVYDNDATLNPGQGASFSDSSPYRTGNANFAGANDLLAASQSSIRAVTYDLWVLKSVGSPGHQDQLIWRAQQVPEPAGLALVALALGAAGLASRRRKA